MRNLDQTTDAVVDLGRMALQFARVNRVTYHEDGATPESDADHTVMLGLIACAVADEHFPQLDLGLVAQYALVHDLVEVYAGDTNTLRVTTANAKAAKQRREHEAYERIAAELGATLPWVHVLIAEYEARTTPEARFVKALDKLLPKITHILNGAKTIRQQGMSLAELAARYEAQIGELSEYAADFPALFDLRTVLVDRVLKVLADQGGEARD